MRSSKSRSRSKNNRNRSMGNVVNRVFDSSGPEGKVRGTPQQIIDKYNQLTRDAQLSNDRVAAENFQQHAEHYLRMLAAAQKEQAERQQNQQKQNERQHANAQQPQQPQQGQPNQNSNRGNGAADQDAGQEARPKVADDVIETSEDQSALVETPENSPPAKPKRTRRKPAQEKAAPEADEQPTAPDAAE